MTPELLAQLRSETATIRQRWEALLRIERVNGPLANPDALVHLIPETLVHIFAALGKSGRPPATVQDGISARLSPCDCGHNPYLAYFVAGEQAIVETVVLLQSKLPMSGHMQSDVAGVIRVVRALARGEIDTFCGICAHRHHEAICRLAGATVA